MSRENRCIKDENGNDVWISRSAVVIPIVLKEDKSGDIYVLIEKRGPDVTHTGEWCCPCGYVDWDESLEEACQREIYEETSVFVNPKSVKFFDVTTNKHSRSQHIDLWYECWVDPDTDFDIAKVRSVNEVTDLRWMKVARVTEKRFMFIRRRHLVIEKSAMASSVKWAFRTHRMFISKILRKRYNNCKITEE